MNIKKAFGSALRDMRNAKKLSQEKLALEADLDRTFVSLLERGLRQPTLTTLFALARVLQCKASDLVSRVEKLTKYS